MFALFRNAHLHADRACGGVGCVNTKGHTMTEVSLECMYVIVMIKLCRLTP